MTRSHKHPIGDKASHGIETYFLLNYLFIVRMNELTIRFAPPYKAKKDGGGKANWYPSPDELYPIILLWVKANERLGAAKAMKSKTFSRKNK